MSIKQDLIPVLGLLLLPALLSCSMKKLGDEIKRADATYGYIKLIAPTTGSAGSTIHVVLYKRVSGGRKMIDVRTIAAGEDAALFLVSVAEYDAVAFDDLNGDFIYQEGEPAQLVEAVPVNLAGETADHSVDNIKDSVTLRLLASAKLAFSVDLTRQSLNAQLERAKNNFLVVTDWDDPKFAPESIQQGMWEPLSFLEDVGYGLYLLEPLDLSKQPVLFVHGINGSPVQFRDLIETLGEQYQALLMQYPSAFPLEHTAYLLQSGLAEYLERFPGQSMHVVAHSMGGLVARGAIVTAEQAMQDRLGTFVSMSTPWLGHEAAAKGVEHSPVVAPVWRSMAPNSEYLQEIFAKPLPDGMDHHLFFSFAKKTGGASAGNDGVVTIKSQLGYPAQLGAVSIFGVNDNHNGILTNPCTAQWLKLILDADEGASPPPDEACSNESAVVEP